jgi:class 3 adenylate cyclase
MPFYMDIHTVPGATAEDVRQAHEADMAVQKKHHVNCLKYWLNEEAGKIFCLVDAPAAGAVAAVHGEAHGLLPEKIIEIDPEMVDGILGPSPVDAAGAVRLPGKGSGRDSAVRSIMFTDMVDSTAVTEALGDDAAMELVNAHDSIVRLALDDFDGREVKHLGDGIMASFISAVSAVRCACRIQGDFARHRDERPELPLALKIGAAAGEPVEQNNDLFGSTVQLAARLCGEAAAGQIVVSTGLAELCRGKGLQFDDLGSLALKGFAEPISAHAVRVQC